MIKDTSLLIPTEHEFRKLLAEVYIKYGYVVKQEFKIPDSKRKVDLYIFKDNVHYFYELKDFRNKNQKQIYKLFGELLIQILDYKELLEKNYECRKFDNNVYVIGVLLDNNDLEYSQIYNLFKANNISILNCDEKTLSLDSKFQANVKSEVAK